MFSVCVLHHVCLLFRFHFFVFFKYSKTIMLVVCPVFGLEFSFCFSLVLCHFDCLPKHSYCLLIQTFNINTQNKSRIRIVPLLYKLNSGVEK